MKSYPGLPIPEVPDRDVIAGRVFQRLLDEGCTEDAARAGTIALVNVDPIADSRTMAKYRAWLAKRPASPAFPGTSPSEGRKPDPCQESTQAPRVDPERS